MAPAARGEVRRVKAHFSKRELADGADDTSCAPSLTLVRPSLRGPRIEFPGWGAEGGAQNGLVGSAIHAIQMWRQRVAQRDDPRLADEVRPTVSRYTFTSLILGSSFGHLALLMFTACVLIVCGALVWMATGECRYEEGCADTFGEALWKSYTLFIDPGTQTGLEIDEDPVKMFVAASLSVLGFIYCLVVLGLIVEKVRLTMDGWKRAHGRVVANGHTVVLGWTEKTLFLLSELAEMLSNGPKRGGRLIVLGDFDEIEMREELAVAFPDWRKRWPRVRVDCCLGKPYEVDDLIRISAFSAKHIMVFGASQSPRVADSLVLSTLCALKSLPERHTITNATSIVVDVRLIQNVSVVKQLGARTITSASAMDALLALMTLDPDVGRAMLCLMSFVGAQIETVSAARFVHHERECTFGSISHRFKQAVVLGVAIHRQARSVSTNPSSMDGTAESAEQSKNHRPSRRLFETGMLGSYTIVLAPSAELQLSELDQLLVIAQSYDAANAVSVHPVASPPRKASVVTASRCPSGGRSENSADMPAGVQATMEEISRVTAEKLELLKSKSISPRKEIRNDALVVLLIGWQRHIGNLLRALDSRLPPDSQLWILSEKNKAWRANELASEGLALDGSALPSEQGLRRSSSQGSGKFPKGCRDEARRSSGSSCQPPPQEGSSRGNRPPFISRSHSMLKESALKNTRLVHLVGFTTDVEALYRLFRATPADAAIVQADVDDHEVDSQITDSEALTSALLLRSLHQQWGQRDFHIVTQFRDVLTHRLLERQPELLDGAPQLDPALASADDFVNYEKVAMASSTRDASPLASHALYHAESLPFHRSYLETAALSVSAHSSMSWGAILMLLDPFGGADLRSIPIAQLLAPEELEDDDMRGGVSLSFWRIHALLLAHGLGILIGWHRKRTTVSRSMASKHARQPFQLRERGRPDRHQPFRQAHWLTLARARPTYCCGKYYRRGMSMQCRAPGGLERIGLVRSSEALC